ncbi:MAG TPA: TonB-dependent receptor, partial [Candidatus Paceibacterota bacterium]|nr:TonB-dependent receptor [Candidatus Paceibacterota bacterium]
MRLFGSWICHFGCCAAWIGVLCLNSVRAGTNAPSSAAALKKLSLEELLNQDVTLVTRTPEKLTQSASAVQVITGEDIRRSGATSIAEALRLASNLQVAQVDSRNWAIDARGFNNTLANKLLVMIDGRTVYTPLFAGVFWDVQNTLLADIDRIEVVSGPGATLWGANAVNGVINIVTKSAKETQGTLIEGGGGSFLHDYGAIRYGGSAGTNFFYRVYGMRFDRGNSGGPSGTNSASASDAWHMTQGGFHADWFATPENTVTFQGDAYSGAADSLTPGIIVDGQNLLGRWSHAFSSESELTVQTYFDRTWRRIPNQFAEDLKTYDLDFQHRFPLTDRQTITWGGSYRLMQDRVGNSTNVAFLPPDRNMQLFSAFVQDEITLLPDDLKLTLGSKFEHNDFSGFEYEPSARLSWSPTEAQTLWAAVSRAVRAPSRIDNDVRLIGGGIEVNGSPEFKSESVISGELGYRIQPHRRVTLSLAAFYNYYENIRSVEPVAPDTYLIENKNRAESRGVELSGTWQATDWWRLRGGYTFLDTHVHRVEGGLDLNRARAEGNDAPNQVLLQSMLDLLCNFEFDVTARFVDTLPSPNVPSHFTFDARLGWHVLPNLEFSILGQNLWDNRHPEFGASGTRHEIPRSVFGKV